MGEQGPKFGAGAELKRSAQDHGSDAPEPTHSEARDRVAARGAARFDDPDTKVERRASVRPSAFGVPRTSSSPPAPEASAPAAGVDESAPHERVLEAARLLDALGPSLLAAELGTAQAEQRLPNQRARGVEHLVARGSSEPRTVAAPNVEQRALEQRALEPQIEARSPSLRAPGHASHPPAANVLARPVSTGAESRNAVAARVARRPWLSLLVFGGMIALSVVPLLRYADSSEAPASAMRGPTAAGPALSDLTAVHESTEVGASSGPPAPALQASHLGREQLIAGLLSEGAHALEANDVHEAERMFGRVLELAEDNPRAAYGLARIRLTQNNLSGAEGWIQLALRKRPRRASYHALYAEVLTRMGRVTEARDEQARAGVSRDNEEP